MVSGNKMMEPFYNPGLSYEENYEQGPFGAYADVSRVPLDAGDGGVGGYDFIGLKVHSPFGIPAGPLINSNFCKAAFKKGFDICVYKTVRSGAYPCHPFPNVLAVQVKGELHYGANKLVANTNYQEPLSITNSFGVPSREADVWQADVRKAISFSGDAQVLVLSFMGTVREDQTEEEFIEDHMKAAKLAKDTGAKILEVNLSCPNIGNEGLICYDLKMTEEICREIRRVIGETPLILKVGYYQDENDLKKLAQIAGKYAQAISAINTIPATIIDGAGKQALPGPNREKSGVCGASIKWAGLEMTRRLRKAREEAGASFQIVGVGGVMSADDFLEYREAGADIVMSATGAMWNPYLAREIKEKL
jgi:dihydroorotate dehydrogenase (NAD+) catalytic subunit